MHEFIPIVAIFMTMSIPLSAIIGSYVLRYKKLNAGTFNNEDKELLNSLMMQVNNQQTRLENLEVIVADLDRLQLNADNQSALKGQIEMIKKEVKLLKEGTNEKENISSST